MASRCAAENSAAARVPTPTLTVPVRNPPCPRRRLGVQLLRPDSKWDRTLVTSAAVGHRTRTWPFYWRQPQRLTGGRRRLS